MKLPPARRSRLKVQQLEDRTTPATITVTTLADVTDGDTSSIPNLIASPGPDGFISLREAIAAAQQDAAADTIHFAPALAKGTISLSQFDTGLDDGEVGPSAFEITTPITIQGSGQVISPETGPRAGDLRLFRLFFVESSGDLTLENLELTGGIAQGGSGFSGGGGAAGLGGAIFNMGALTVRNSTLDGNWAKGGNGGTFDQSSGGGGGLGQSATGQDGGGPNRGTFESETQGPDGGFGGGGSGGSEGAAGNGGFGGGGGGGIFGGNGGAGGFGGGGGGSDTGTPEAGGFGGLAANGANGGPGAGMGGAVFNLLGTVNIANSTITGNLAVGGGVPDRANALGNGYGGGVFNLDGTLTVVNSTFAANMADTGGSVYNLAHDASEGVPTGIVPTAAINPSAAAIQVGVEADATLANSIFVDSLSNSIPAGLPSADEVHNAVFPTGNASGGALIANLDASAPNITDSDGFANDGGTMNASGVITTTRQVVNGTLADNGGPTRTMALTPDSEAIDAGDNAKAVDPATGDPLTTDQRGPGFPRVVNGTVDLGAFEVQATSPPPITPDTVVFTSPTAVVVRNGPANGPTIADPFPDFAGENRVAVGDVDRDGVPDYVFAPGFGGGPRVVVVSGKTGAELRDFFAYDPGFRGGVFVAAGDINGDGFADIITGAGTGGGPQVRVFSGQDGAVLANFFAYDPAFRGGVSVAAGDVTGDGVPDIVTGPGPGEGDQLLAIDGTKLAQADPATGLIQPAAVAATFAAPDPEFAGGVVVAVGNLDGDQFADVVAGPLGATAPRLLAFRGSDHQQAASLLVFPPPALNTGLRLAVADVDGNGTAEVLAIAGPGGGPQTVVLDPFTGQVIESTYTFDSALRTGFDVG